MRPLHHVEWSFKSGGKRYYNAYDFIESKHIWEGSTWWASSGGLGFTLMTEDVGPFESALEGLHRLTERIWRLSERTVSHAPARQAPAPRWWA